MPDQQDIYQQLELLKIHRQTLHLYLTQMAIVGGISQASPSVIHGIREARSGIDRIKQILRTWKVSVEDHPDDEGALEEHAAPSNLLVNQDDDTLEHGSSYRSDKISAYKDLFNRVNEFYLNLRAHNISYEEFRPFIVNINSFITMNSLLIESTDQEIIDEFLQSAHLVNTAVGQSNLSESWGTTLLPRRIMVIEIAPDDERKLNVPIEILHGRLAAVENLHNLIIQRFRTIIYGRE